MIIQDRQVKGKRETASLGKGVDCRPMSFKQHDPEQVAGLIYDSSPELFSLMFGSQEIQTLTRLIRGTENRFSYQHIRVAQIANQAVGVAVIVPAEKVDWDTDLKVLSYPQRLRFELVKRLVFPFVLQRNYPQGSFLISHLAVASQYRNVGSTKPSADRAIAQQLLFHCIDEAAANSSSVYTSVDVDHVRTQRLYQSAGFELVQEKALRLGGFRVGSFVLALYP